MKGDETGSYYQNINSHEMISDGMLDSSAVNSNKKSDLALMPISSETKKMGERTLSQY